ncbi:E3 ubiquitin-protein ligase RGLG5 isoform X1 [Beta vulgaris subsp. vulgaris]|uniref:E3 ubiquitin-protein ligase RGLG5 isoform X1 n=2 Tax=Beta vulgaris subsp. vulgaris TaxID=3555 RepID=UPI002036EA64|nr:E3 ubiquitin-protein ligase RGLG5 isoform X1 [Beta vulgaris subsp. vulgaris]XP_010682338.2 E3 ubiquitin-protein ligase RGLG5 isoform X1 [Beta vulgaris subsp. vulgaris]XP_048493440.1 E3 ubiquitin-protein ligase RGLG5 isoform X1 [Beta vulgaris subsp. vulgaris]
MFLWLIFLVALVYVVWRSGIVVDIMGGKSSKSSSRRRSMPPSYEWNSSQNYGYPPTSPYPSQPSYAPQTPYRSHQPQYAPSPSPSPSPHNYAPPPPSATRPKKTLERKYSRIADNYRTLDEVTAALAHAGLESSNLIVGIDFTKSNEWTGAKSFNRRSLHHIGNDPNPYEEAIAIIGKTLSVFDEDNLIPCYGFGDASTHDQDVFSFYEDDRPCQGFEEVMSRYRELVPQLRLAGPTSFAPVIEMAMTIVEQSGGQYHVLLIIADGQVTRSVDTQQGNLSPQEQKTIEAIVQASEYPLSIVLVGVGDGPWDMMREFDDNIPARAFDNFQFVNFTQIMSKNMDTSKKQTEFALSALMEIPSQYKATLEHGILGRRTGHCSERVCLPPPQYNSPSGGMGSKSYSRTSSFQQSPPTYPRPEPALGTSSSSAPAYSSSTAPPSTSAYENQLCPICITSPKNMAFGCGHQTCCDCGEFLDACPICRRSIETRIRLY